ncbi:5450_t:CDS:2, partial [Gigaspora rosea]
KQDACKKFSCDGLDRGSIATSNNALLMRQMKNCSCVLSANYTRLYDIMVDAVKTFRS